MSGIVEPMLAGTVQSPVRVLEWLPEHDDNVRLFVDQHAAGLVYYTPQFRDFLCAVTQSVSVGTLAWRGGKVSGVLPLHRIEGRYGAVLNTLPFFGSNGGVLAGDETSFRLLLAAYEKQARSPGVTSAVWISNPFDLNSERPGCDLSDRRIAQWTDLAGDTDILTIIDSSAARNVKKALSSGIVAREAPEAIDFLEAVHRQNMSAIGGRIKPPEFFSSVAGQMEYARDWRLYVAERGEEKLAALLTFEAARTVEYVMPAVLDDARTLQPTAAILLHAMTDAAKRGMRRWNWGGTWLSQDGVYRFKKKWGAQEREYDYCITLNDRDMLQRTPAELTDAYGYFYTVPFEALTGKQ